MTLTIIKASCDIICTNKYIERRVYAHIDTSDLRTFPHPTSGTGVLTDERGPSLE